MSLRSQKLQKLVEIEGFESEDELFAASLMDSVCPCICMNEGCDYTEELEPDQREGWCSECKTNSMKSGLVLGEII